MKKIYANEKCTNETYKKLKISQDEKQPSNVFLTKGNQKCNQPNKKVVLQDIKCS